LIVAEERIKVSGKRGQVSQRRTPLLQVLGGMALRKRIEARMTAELCAGAIEDKREREERVPGGSCYVTGCVGHKKRDQDRITGYPFDAK